MHWSLLNYLYLLLRSSFADWHSNRDVLYQALCDEFVGSSLPQSKSSSSAWSKPYPTSKPNEVVNKFAYDHERLSGRRGWRNVATKGAKSGATSDWSVAEVTTREKIPQEKFTVSLYL